MLAELRERRRPTGRPRRRFEDNIKNIFKTWSGEAQNAFMWFRIGTGGLFWLIR